MKFHLPKAKEFHYFLGGEVLAELVNSRYGVVVCGAHGKTTTTSLIGAILKDAGLDPTCFIGGEVDALGGNACFGSGEICVAEGDESDGSFLKLRPRIGVVTSIDQEHLDYYQGDSEMDQAYQLFMNQCQERGTLVACVDDPRIDRILSSGANEVMGYGLSERASIRGEQVQLGRERSQFSVTYQEAFLAQVVTHLPGRHNVLNTLAAIAVGLKMEIPIEKIVQSVHDFSGVKRRFEIKNRESAIWVVDDYAHHPTEILATLESVRGLERKRAVAVFQPHRYTRTEQLMDRFARVLAQFDQVILLDIYSAGEEPIQSIDSGRLSEKILQYGGRSECSVREALCHRLMEIVHSGDTLLFLGAGDITLEADVMVKVLDEEWVAHARS